MNSKQAKCPKGTRRNKKTGICDPKDSSNETPIIEALNLPTPINEPESIIEEPSNEVPKKGKRRQYCPQGFRRNRKTGICEPIEKPDITETIEFIPLDESENEKQKTPLIEIARYTQTPSNEPVHYESEPETESSEVSKKSNKTKNKKLGTFNEFLLEKEKKEAEQADSSKSELYPILGEPNFAAKIAQRKEFSDTLYNGTIENKSIIEETEKLCQADFELSPHQLFVKNFLSFQTPYNTLLLYHGLGTGKTCSAIGIAEESRMFMKQMGHSKKIIVVASPNVQQNFRIQLFDERKLEQIDGIWNIESCVGNQLLNEINPMNLIGYTRERIIQQIRTIILKSYIFMGYGEFGNFIDRNISVSQDSGLNEEETKKRRFKNIKQVFNKRLIIIDEIHNLRITDVNKNKRTAILLNEIALKSDDMRLVVLSATPMFNSYAEIIWLTNLLNANDKRALIKQSDVFDKNGEFVKGNSKKESGKELLKRKLKGYVSYVRGENPFTFPYRVYPKTFAPEHMMSSENYPLYQMNNITLDEPLKHVPVYTNKIAEYQNRGYDFIMKDMTHRSYDKTTNKGNLIQMPTFENMDSFGYTLLLAPMEALNIVYPNEFLDSYSDSTPIETYTPEKRKNVISSFIGKEGLHNIMSMKQQENPYPIRYNYEYKPKILEQYGSIFSPSEISKYSHKISNICNIIKNSKGIILVYSQFIDGGIIPMALALEEMGFARYGSAHYTKNLFKKPPSPPLDANTLEPLEEDGKKRPAGFKQAKYVMITGDKHFSPNNSEDIKHITTSDNKNGELVKVILISRAAAEGLDFKNIRQVHILDPWYNMNRNEQIIGRAVRNLSHCKLPFEERNVEIYLHSTLQENNEVEMADMYVYRVAEKKAIEIGRITRLLKEVAVDCLLNISQTNFTQEKLNQIIENQNIKINLSSGKTIDFQPGDLPYTDVCDYMDNCDFKCDVSKDAINDEVIQNTYNNIYIQNTAIGLTKRIRELFRDRSVYNRQQLISSINFYKKYPIEHIYYALTQFIMNHNIELIDKYGRTGYLVNNGLYYAFQPSEINDTHASIYERNTPVLYKNESLVLELPKTFSIQKKKKEKSDSEDSVLQKENENKISRTYDKLLEDLKENIEMVHTSNLKIYSGEYNYYKYANTVINILLEYHKIPLQYINKYLIYHWTDVLETQEKLELIKNLYFNSPKENPSGYEKHLKSYFENKRFEISSQKRDAFVVATQDKNTIYVYDKNKGELIEAGHSDKEEISPMIKERFSIPKNQFHAKLIGFMYLFKNKEIVFKIKDLTQARNNMGAKATSADKKELIEKLSSLNDGKDVYTETGVDKYAICVLLEVLCRYLTETTKKVYYLDFEEAIQNDIVKLKFS